MAIPLQKNKDANDRYVPYVSGGGSFSGSGGGSGSGTVNAGAAHRLAYYPSAGTTVDDADAIRYDPTADPTIKFIYNGGSSENFIEIRENDSVTQHKPEGTAALLTLHSAQSGTLWQIVQKSDQANYSWSNFVATGDRGLIWESDAPGSPFDTFHGGIVFEPTLGGVGFYNLGSGTHTAYVWRDVSADAMYLGHSATIAVSGAVKELTIVAGGVGVNKSSSLGAQFHVISGDNARIGAIIDSAAAPSVDIFDVKKNGTNVFQITSTGSLVHTSAARTSGVAPYARIITPADTGITADTEGIGIAFGGSSANPPVTVTRTLADGTTLALQREYVFTAPTYAAAGATTITHACTVAITDMPAIGSNVTATLRTALWVQNGVVLLNGNNASDNSGLSIQNGTGSISLFNYNSSPFITLSSGGSNYFQVTPSGANISIGPAGGGIGVIFTAGGNAYENVDSVGNVSFAAPARTGTKTYYFQIVTPADTSLTASTESIGVQIGGNTSAATVTRQFAGGALTTQREYVFVAPTYGFASASTLTTAATVAITNAPIAGTNATITNKIALLVQAGQSWLQANYSAAAAPVLQLGSSTGNGLSGTAGNSLIFSLASNNQFSMGYGGWALASNVIQSWNSGTDITTGSQDTGLARAKQGVVAINGGASYGGGATWATAARSPSQITSNQDNYNPVSSNVGYSYFLRLSTDASRDITGLTYATQTDGEVHLIVNVGAQNIVLKNESASSTAANRFTCSTGADITLSANQAADVIYDGTTSRWLVYKRN